jgi:hypothetical protein
MLKSKMMKRNNTFRITTRPSDDHVDLKHEGPPYHDMDDLAGSLSHEEAEKMLKELKRMRRLTASGRG